MRKKIKNPTKLTDCTASEFNDQFCNQIQGTSSFEGDTAYGKYDKIGQRQRKSSLLPVDLETSIKKCDFYLAVSCVTPVDFSIGQMCVKIPEDLVKVVPQLLESVKEFWIYGSMEPNCSLVYFEWSASMLTSLDDTKYSVPNKSKTDPDCRLYFTIETLPYKVLEGVKSGRSLALVYSSFNEADSQLMLQLLLKQNAFVSDTDPNSMLLKRNDVRLAVSFFNGLEEPSLDESKFNEQPSILEFYSLLSAKQREKILSSNVEPQHEFLKPTLRPYQKQAVQWMVSREQSTLEDDYFGVLFEPLTIFSGQKLYYNKYNGCFIKHRYSWTQVCNGGVLADEMGLGKTVEVLSCVLTNPRLSLPEFHPDMSQLISAIDGNKEYEHKHKRVRICENKSLTGETSSITGEEVGYQVQVEEKVIHSGDETILLSDVGCVKGQQEHDTDDLSGAMYTQEFLATEISTPAQTKMESCETFETVEKQADSIGDVIESVIENICYSGDNSLRRSSRRSSRRPNSMYLESKTSVSKTSKQKKGTTFERLQSFYQEQLSAMSLSHKVKSKQSQKRHRSSTFECVCGEGVRNTPDKAIVTCQKCGLKQHASCVNYDSSNELFHSTYFCPHCWQTQPTVPSKSTLIVAPAAICPQWAEEIKTHIVQKGLNIYVYRGVNKQGFIQPQSLADFDIVIVAYETLRKELDYTDLPHSCSEDGRKFRNPKRFMAIPSPLPCIEWWRACLDEAQLVERLSSRTAEMANRLVSINRWCVTGTPIQNSINDLQGLLQFLRIAPYNSLLWWKKLLYEPYQHGQQDPLLSVISDCTWRTAKKDVKDQINIPPLTEEIHWLQFTPVEDYFYKNQIGELSWPQIFMRFMGPYLDTRLSDLNKVYFNSVMEILTQVRQACCHPELTSRVFFTMQKNAMTMEELLRSLVAKAKVDVEEAHRQRISALHGLAAIHCIKEEWEEAVSKYRDVLQLVADNEGVIKTDSLQRLHAMYNLSEILNMKVCNAPPTLRDESLSTECAEIRKRFIEKNVAVIEKTQQGLQTSSSNQSVLLEQLHGNEKWWLEVLLGCTKSNMSSALLHDVWGVVSGVYESRPVNKKYTSLFSLEKTLANYLSKAESLRTAITSGLFDLKSRNKEVLVAEAVDCHLRDQVNLKDRKTRCELCTFHDLLEEYELLLFNMNENQKQGALNSDGVFVYGELRRGTWKPSHEELIMKVLLTFGRGKLNLESWVITAGQTHIKLLDLRSKEFKPLRDFWRALYDEISSHDELNMSTIRLRLRYEDEPKSKSLKSFRGVSNDPIYVLEPHELAGQKFRMETQLTVAENDVKKKYGRLSYLTNLQKSDFCKKGGENPEPCPICQKPFGEQWNVFPCGHCFCLDCVKTLMINLVGGLKVVVNCALCRQNIHRDDISLVSIAREQDRDVQINGSYSTKVTAIIRTVLRLRQNEPGVKILIFSSWVCLLNILANGLTENEISFRNLSIHDKFGKHLKQFKTQEDINVLLMPVSSGSKGLNIVEANHVFIVEPLLDVSEELQAIGRVHRIGQLKSTYVHRFLVRQTIEEKMHVMLEAYRSNYQHGVSEIPITVRAIKDLFPF